MIDSSRWHPRGSHCCHFPEDMTEGWGPAVARIRPFFSSSCFPLWGCGSHPGLQSDKSENDGPAWGGRMEKREAPGSLSASLLPSLLARGIGTGHCPAESVFPAARSIATWYRHFWVRTIESLFLLVSK